MLLSVYNNITSKTLYDLNLTLQPSSLNPSLKYQTSRERLYLLLYRQDIL